jgi:hypothetical protein
MRLLFRGGSELVIFEINRENKTLAVTSSKTNYRSVFTDWFSLFDKGKEEEQEQITDKLTDKLFIKAISQNMNKNGYILVNSKC